MVSHNECTVGAETQGKPGTLLVIKGETFPIVVSNSSVEHPSVLLQKLQFTGKSAKCQSSRSVRVKDELGVTSRLVNGSVDDQCSRIDRTFAFKHSPVLVDDQ